MPPPFILYPAIDLRHGKVVQLVGGDPKQVAVAWDDAHETFRKWEQAKSTWVHVVDLDAAFGERNQWSQLPRLIGHRVRVQFGGGVRSMTQIQQLIELGVERVVVGTQGVLNPLWVRELCKVFPGRIVLAVDARGRDVVVKGWTESAGKDVVELARSLDDASLAGFLYTNVEKEGRLQGIDKRVVEDLRRNAPKTPLIVSGGITSMDDLEWLAEHGAQGAVLGMSIYTGTLDLAKANERFPQPVHRPRAIARAMQDEDPEGADGYVQVIRGREVEDPDADPDSDPPTLDQLEERDP
jgi:phosphoribosylformimino-5-aminoimidazole carboxamide ribotide isomerase